MEKQLFFLSRYENTQTHPYIYIIYIWGRRKGGPRAATREDNVTRRCQSWKRRRTRATKRATRSRFFLPRRRRLSPAKSRRRRNPSCKAPISPPLRSRLIFLAGSRFRLRVYRVARRCSRSYAWQNRGGVRDVAVGFAGFDLVQLRLREKFRRL